MQLHIVYNDKNQAIKSLLSLLNDLSCNLIYLDVDHNNNILLVELEPPSNHTGNVAIISSLKILSGIESILSIQNPDNFLLKKATSNLPESLYTFDNLITNDTQMLSLLEQAKCFSKLSEPILITGETGTGKDVIAEACHRFGPRKDKKFLALNCASLPPEFTESELYGYASETSPEKKGFFEQAEGGSVLLDEIGEMPLTMQVKLLRFINNGTFRRVGAEKEIFVDVRVICSTQVDLLHLVKSGKFREDLYYRLNVLPLYILPLRERKDDIKALSHYFIKLFSVQQGINDLQVSNGFYEELIKYPWPGNVRQLKNTLYLAITKLQNNILSPESLQIDKENIENKLIHYLDDNFEGNLEQICKRFEKRVLQQLYMTYPSSRKLAKRLGVSHTSIANKIKEYSLSLNEKKGGERS